MAGDNRSLTPLQQAFRPSSANLGRSVAHGAAFTMLIIALRTVLTFGSMAVLARMLAPKDFGLIAMTTVVTEMAALFANFGFGAILIQRPRISRIQIDTIFWAALSLGVMLTATVFCVSFFAESLFKEAMVGDLLRVLCICFILEELTVIPRSMLSRTLQFRKDFVTQISGLLARVTAAVAMALMGFGVWSLALGGLVALFVQVCIYHRYVVYVPRFRFSRAFLLSSWRINSGYFGNGLLFYINYNIDVFLIGRMLGASPLGIYLNARSLTDEVRARIAIPLQQVLFPAFSVLQNEHERFRAGILKSGRLLALLVVPIGFGIAAIAEELVPLLYGEQWLAMIPLLKIISIASGVRATTTIGNPIFNATNRVGLSFRLFFIGTVIFVVLMLIGSHWGLTGFAYALLLSTVPSLVFFRISLGLVRLDSVHLWQILGVPTVSGAVMFVVIALARDAVYALTPLLFFRMFALVLLGMLVYSATVLLISRAYYEELRDVLRKFGHSGVA